MKSHELEKLGVRGSCIPPALAFIAKAGKLQRFKVENPKTVISDILANPSSYLEDNLARDFAKRVIEAEKLVHKGPAPYKIWGEDQIELGAINQIHQSVQLPVSFKAALMPDAHQGYGLPIGGVLATVGAVIPFCVGVDIACRMKLSIIDCDIDKLKSNESGFIEALNSQTAFGKGCEFKNKRQHQVMDQDWNVSPITKQMKETAWSQLGTSGGGNHFVEWGIIEFKSQDIPGVELNKKYLGLLSHSGSRGTGAKVCAHYTSIAQKSLPSDFAQYKNLAWLELDLEPGQEYWNAMNLMGEYASANHDCIHRHVIEHIGLTSSLITQIENHHNFAWKEKHDGVEVIVHRKGATPAGQGVFGVIPGSMADPAYIVKGLGNPDSLNSASHGAGRRMSRSKAKEHFNWEYWSKELKNRDVKLISAGIDEVPGAYKNINEVMLKQSDLVEIIAKFAPKIVRMADDGFAED
jgi:tRNA-splicing ligase RtcB